MPSDQVSICLTARCAAAALLELLAHREFLKGAMPHLGSPLFFARQACKTAQCVHTLVPQEGQVAPVVATDVREGLGPLLRQRDGGDDMNRRRTFEWWIKVDPSSAECYVRLTRKRAAIAAVILILGGFLVHGEVPHAVSSLTVCPPPSASGSK
jgi:hypothetical protein